MRPVTVPGPPCHGAVRGRRRGDVAPAICIEIPVATTFRLASPAISSAEGCAAVAVQDPQPGSACVGDGQSRRPSWLKSAVSSPWGLRRTEVAIAPCERPAAIADQHLDQAGRVAGKIRSSLPSLLTSAATRPRGFCAAAGMSARSKPPAPFPRRTGDRTPVRVRHRMGGAVRLRVFTRGERVLIHAAAGGVGIAAIQLAKAAGPRSMAPHRQVSTRGSPSSASTAPSTTARTAGGKACRPTTSCSTRSAESR